MNPNDQGWNHKMIRGWGRLQRRILVEYLRAYSTAYGTWPTIDEVRRRLDVASPNVARNHLLTLAKDGYVEQVPRVARGFRLTEKGWEELPPQ